MTDSIPTNSTNNFLYEPPTSQQYQYKIYIHNCNSYIGSSLVEQFRNDHIIEANPNIIIGSTIKANQPQTTPPPSEISVPVIPSGVNHIIDTSNQRFLNSVLIEADIILFNLDKNNIQDFEYILKFLKNFTHQKQKRIICITSLLSWAKRSSVSPSQVSKDRIHLRNSLDYHVKYLQDLCLAVCHQNQKLKGSVIYSGLVYGLGEDSLFPYFKQALEQQKPLEIYGKGTNFIPTIHLKDLSSIVQNITFGQYQRGKNWHIACDSSKLTQKQLITCIAQNLGNGSVVQKPIEECFSKENFDELSFDLEIVQKQQLEQWHCKDGLKNGIQYVVGQFNQYRGLKPNKIIILGPPVSGKTTIAEILKKSYGLPVINMQNLIEEIRQDQSQFGKQIQNLLEQIKTQKVQEQRKAYEQMKKKKKGKGVEDFDPNKIVPRLPHQPLKNIIKWRLNFSDCLNKGYILDSVIKSYKLAQDVFLAEEGTVNSRIFPNSVFAINATEDLIKDRVKSLPLQKTVNTHWTEQHTVRRLQNFAKQNEDKNVRQFFEINGGIQEVDLGYSDSTIFSKFVQRNGPLGFKKQAQLISSSHELQQEKLNKSEVSGQNQEDESEEQVEERQLEEQFNLQKLTAKQQRILNQKSRPIRQYLIDNVIPQITEGLLQICKQVPEDPIQFLIGFLQRKNLKKHR